MSDNRNTGFMAIMQVLAGLFAVIAIKSLFEQDNDKIISKKGSDVLLDNEKMQELERKISEQETNQSKNVHSEIVI